MTINEIVALASVVLSIGTNISLYIHLSSVMNTRFDAAQRDMKDLNKTMTALEIDVALVKDKVGI